MHSHKHTPAPRWLNCAPMHLQWQNSALNGSHLHQCRLTHSKCTQATLASMPPYTLRMHSTNSCINASLHTQNALNQLLHQCLLTHSECTQPTLASMRPYTLRMHLTNSNQVLYESNVHKYTLVTHSRLTMLDCTSNASKYLQRAPIQTCAPPNSKLPRNPQSSPKALQSSS